MNSLQVGVIAFILTSVLFVGFELYSNNSAIQYTSLNSSLENSTVIEKIIEKPTYVEPLVRKITVPLVAIDSVSEGKVVNVEITRLKGTGKILVDVSKSLVSEKTQESLVNATIAAGELDPNTRMNLRNSDLIFSFSSKGIHEVTGGSAGVAIATAVAVLLNDKGINSNILITGGISINGSVTPVGGVYEKAKAAKNKGFTYIIIPKGQDVQSVNFVNETQKCIPAASGVQECTVYRSAQRKDVNVSDVGILVREVSTLKEVYAIAVVS